MYRSLSKRFAIFTLKATLTVVTVFGAVYYASWLMTVDPFQRYRQGGEKRLGDNIAMRLGDVMVTSYDGERLVSRAFVKRIDIQSDRQNLELTGIRDGVMIGKDGKFNFSANKAFYKAFQGVITVREGARISNEDMDLTLEGFTYSEQSERLRSFGAIRGKLMNGQIQAVDLEYQASEGTYRTGPLKWTGMLASALDIQSSTAQDPKQGDLKRWEIDAKGSFSQRGDIATYEQVHATDGEIIVKAPKVELNKKTDVLTATGRVYYYSGQANLICDKAVIYRKEKRAVLTGNVTMLIKPKDQEKLEETELKPFNPIVPDEIKIANPAAPKQDQGTPPAQDSGTLRKYPVSVFAEKIEYWYGNGNRKANISGRPQARQDLPEGEWRHVWSHTAFYDGEADTLKLESRDGKRDAQAKTSIGDDLIAFWFKISTKDEEEDNWEGFGVQGAVMVNKDELPDRGGGTGGGGGNPPPLRGGIGGGQPTRRGGL
ncbi:MAG: hypothetical protein KF784_12335 [Fimbriimonadaceae bacterium]|nr:hypothetical protein [Fimbriimonadaceae bacterium]